LRVAQEDVVMQESQVVAALAAQFGDRFTGSQEFHGLHLELFGVSFTGLAEHNLDFRR